MSQRTWKEFGKLETGDVVYDPTGQLVKIVSLIMDEPKPGFCTAIAEPSEGGPYCRFWYHADFKIGVEPLSVAHDPVNHPSHYTAHPSGIECITITEHMNFNVGNAVKYLWRAGSKGNALEDLKKAAWYVNREIERIGKAVNP